MKYSRLLPILTVLLFAGLVAAQQQNYPAAGLITASQLNQGVSKNFAGTCAMSSATTCTATVTASFTSTPLCFGQDQSHVTTDSCALSGTTVTITASASNSTTHEFILVGNPN
jgi:hypothetical protein